MVVNRTLKRSLTTRRSNDHEKTVLSAARTENRSTDVENVIRRNTTEADNVVGILGEKQKPDKSVPTPVIVFDTPPRRRGFSGGGGEKR